MAKESEVCRRERWKDQSKSCSSCNDNLASQADFYLKVLEDYKPYDYTSDRSFKYKQHRRNQNVSYVPTKSFRVHCKFDPWKPQLMDRVKVILDPTVPMKREDMIDQHWTKWIPVECNTVDSVLRDRTLENDITIRKSPYRTIEKSVLTDMLPIKPFIVKQKELRRWDMEPVYNEVYSTHANNTGEWYKSMMTRYYEDLVLSGTSLT